MKRLIKRAFSLCAVLSLIIFPLLPCEAFLTAYAVSEELTEYTDRIIEFELQKTGNESVQSFLDGTAAENAAGMYDRIVFGLMQSGKEYDFSEFSKALAKNAAADTKANAVEKERYALILSAFDGNEAYITNVLDECTGKLGIMSYIYALHIINNGFSASELTAEEIISDIL